MTEPQALQHLLVDHPLPGVCRLTLNRPEKRNALNNRLRGEVLAVAFQTEASQANMGRFCRDGESVSKLLSERDAGFGDYRERGD